MSKRSPADGGPSELRRWPRRRPTSRTWPAELPVIAAVVFGSYARGDFNTSSDIDVLVVSDALPTGFRERIDVLWRQRPPGLEPVGWTVAEHAERRRRGDPIASEADHAGVVVLGAVR